MCNSHSGKMSIKPLLLSKVNLFYFIFLKVSNLLKNIIKWLKKLDSEV